MILACIFDFDGVIADTEELHYLSYQPVLKEKGLEFTYEEYSARYMAFDAVGCFRQRAADCGVPLTDEIIRDWSAKKNRCYDELIATRDVQPLAGAIDAVKLAASKGPIAVCTGAVQSDVAPLLKAFGIADLFQTVVTADDVNISKPDPECYALAVTRLEVSAAECLAIEDTPGGLKAARGAGCQTLGVTTTHSRKELTAFADRVIGSLTEFGL